VNFFLARNIILYDACQVAVSSNQLKWLVKRCVPVPIFLLTSAKGAGGSGHFLRG